MILLNDIVEIFRAPNSDQPTLIIVAHCDAVGGGIHAINKAAGNGKRPRAMRSLVVPHVEGTGGVNMTMAEAAGRFNRYRRS